MLKQLHRCAFILGALLVLLAFVLVARVQFATSHQHAYQTLRVAQAVTHLEGGCLTCHSMLARTPPSVFPAIAHPQIDHSDWRLLADFATTTAAPHATVDAQLLTVGKRILALPDYDDGRQDEVIAAFLQTYDEIRTITTDLNPQVMQGVLWRIDGIETLLQLLENQASPHKWDREDSTQFQANLTILNSAPVLPATAVLHHGLPLGDAVADRWTVHEEAYQFVMPLEIVFATQRRGPPVGDVFSDSV